jgi:hypothetical protein
LEAPRTVEHNISHEGAVVGVPTRWCSTLLRRAQSPDTPTRHLSAPTDQAPPRIRELADTAPTDGTRAVLLSIADLCEAELETIDDAPPPSPQ